MNLKRISIKEMNIENYKNIEKGTIESLDLKKIKKDPNMKENHVLGIYGQNGSGKTAVIEVLAILKLVLSGECLPTSVFEGISFDKEVATFGFTFFIEIREQVYLVYYSFELIKRKKLVQNEKIKLKQYANGWSKTRTILETSVDSNSVLTPKKLETRIKKYEHDSYLNMRVYKELVSKLSCSYLFYEESFQLLKAVFKQEEIEEVLICLQHFGKHCLIILQNLYQGLKEIALIREYDKERIHLNLLESNTANESTFTLINKMLHQLNKVFKPIIPEMELIIHTHHTKIIENEKQIVFEVFSSKEGYLLPLAKESSGIKKILSILNALIIMFNNPNITLAIDELDSGIFEFLLGELLRVIEESNQGYLFFTSHNLRALERLNKESIVFTTTNKKQRFVRLTKIRNTSNLREQYFRNLILKEQKEELYQEGNPYEIKHFLKKAYYDEL